MVEQKEISEKISAKEFAALKDRSESWGAKLAKHSAVIQKNPFPVKLGRMWFASLEEWEKALSLSGWKMRRTKPRKKKNK